MSLNVETDGRKLIKAPYTKASAADHTVGRSEVTHVRCVTETSHVARAGNSTPGLVMNPQVFFQCGSQVGDSVVRSERTNDYNVHHLHLNSGDNFGAEGQLASDSLGSRDTHPQSIDSRHLSGNSLSLLPSTGNTDTDLHLSHCALCKRNIVQDRGKYLPPKTSDTASEDICLSKPAGVNHMFVEPNCNDHIYNDDGSIPYCQNSDVHPNRDDRECSESSHSGKAKDVSGNLTSTDNLSELRELHFLDYQIIGSGSSSIDWVRRNPRLRNSYFVGHTDGSITQVTKLPPEQVVRHTDGSITQVTKLPPEQISDRNQKKCNYSAANSLTGDNVFSSRYGSFGEKHDVEHNCDDATCDSLLAEQNVGGFEALLHEANKNVARNESSTDREEKYESESKPELHSTKFIAQTTCDDHVDDKEVTSMSNADNEEDSDGKVPIAALSNITKYKDSKGDEKLLRIEELNPIRRLFFAHENNKIPSDKFYRLVKSTNMRKIIVSGNDNTLISSLLIAVSEVERGLTREKFCECVMSELRTNITEYGQFLRNDIRLETFQRMCEAYFKGGVVEMEIDILYRVFANAFALNLNLISVDSDLKKHVLKAYDCTRCTSTDNIFIFFSWRGNKETKMYPHYDCYVKEKFFQKNHQLIKYLMTYADAKRDFPQV